MTFVELSATRLARLIRDREASAVDVVEAHLARIESLNSAINAIVTIAPDALARAAERDRELQRDPEVGPLHGVPFTAKDIFETADLPTTLGLPELAGNRPDRDATAVARMRAAGAILIGKTNCPPGGGGGDTVNELFGRTRNPYDVKRSPGGSSGGEAAAITSGMSPCGLGSDSGGSLRMPAHFCGVGALKPTAGRIPVSGVLDELGALGPMSDPRTQPGPMARRVEDLATLLAVLAGPDGRDGGAVPVPLRDPDAALMRGLRITLHTLTGDAAPDAGTDRALHEALSSLTAVGAEVVDRPPPDGGHALTQRVWESYDGEMPTSELYRILREWDRYRSEMLSYLATVDVILSPVAPRPAPRHGGRVDWRYTTPHSLTGWPCVVVRAGTSQGLPVGVQVIAGPWRDEVALAAAACIEAALGGWRPPEAVSA